MPPRVRIVLLLLTFLAIVPIRALAEKVSVTEQDGVYTVSGQFDVLISPSVTWSFLTDYHRVHLIVSTVETDSVERFHDGRVLIHQKLTTKNDGRVRLTMQAHEDTIKMTVSIRDTMSEDFRGYAGEFRVADGGTHSIVYYLFKVQPKLRYVPTVWAKKRIVWYKIQGIIKRLQKEMNDQAAAVSRPRGASVRELP